jgi:enoyl-CoA hydratase
MRYTTLKYAVTGRIARITLNRPARLNAIDDKMPREIRRAVEAANDDDKVHVIVLAGAGKAFCAGYDLKKYAEGQKDRRRGVAKNRWNQSMPWDPMKDYRGMKANTDDFFSIWRSYKPVICKVQGYAVAGGSDIALCADIVIMEDKAKIGYMPARVWGCPTTAMWVYRLGAEKRSACFSRVTRWTGKPPRKWAWCTRRCR